MSKGTERRLAAVVSADMVGYARLMGVDEVGTLDRLRAHRAELIDPKIAAHGGRIVKTMGDGLLLAFVSVVAATRCSIEIQQAMAARNGPVPDDQRMVFRIGVNLGDVIVDGDDILGDGVNVAARLQEIAAPGGIAISHRLLEEVQDRLDASFADAGVQTLKNIARPVQVWRWSPGGEALSQPAAPAVSAPLPLPDKPSIAVLPFDNLSGDPEQAYFADGVTEDIITALSRLRWLFVIARNSTFAYKGEAYDVRRIAEDLGVQYILEGSVRKAGARLRVTAQVIDAAGGRHIWADRYDRTLEDIFELQDEITATIVGMIAPELDRAEIERAKRKTRQDLDAWDRCLLASWHFRERTSEGIHAAIELYREAIGASEQFVPAHIGLAKSYVQLILYRLTDDREAALDIAFDAAKCAVALDRSDAAAHSILGRVFDMKGRFAESLREHEMALRLDVNSAIGHMYLASAFSHNDDPARALPEAEQAIRLSPRDPEAFFMHQIKAIALSRLGRHSEAIDAAALACHHSRNEFWPHTSLAIVSAHAGALGEAKLALEEARRRQPDLSAGYIRDAFSTAGPGYRSYLIDGLRKAGLTD